MRKGNARRALGMSSDIPRVSARHFAPQIIPFLSPLPISSIDTALKTKRLATDDA